MQWLDQASQYWPHIAAGFDVLAAALASIHALLHKRDTRAATIWISVVWTLPVLGSVLYLALGVNRIRRRAVKLAVHKSFARPVPEDFGETEHAGAEHLKHIARVVNRFTAQPLTAGNKIEPLVNGDAAFPAMLDAINAAKKSISLCTYIFDNDPSSGKNFCTHCNAPLTAASPCVSWWMPLAHVIRGRPSPGNCDSQKFPSPSSCPLPSSHRGAWRPSISATTANCSLWTVRPPSLVE